MSVLLCCSACLFLYGPFCHGALKLDMSTLFTTFFLWKSLQLILSHVHISKSTDFKFRRKRHTHICIITPFSRTAGVYVEEVLFRQKAIFVIVKEKPGAQRIQRTYLCTISGTSFYSMWYHFVFTKNVLIVCMFMKHVLTPHVGYKTEDTYCSCNGFHSFNKSYLIQNKSFSVKACVLLAFKVSNEKVKTLRKYNYWFLPTL